MAKEIIYLGSDHAGFKMKNAIARHLKKLGFKVHDDGPAVYNPDDDYPDYALKVCKNVISHKARGILICGSGQGMDIAANKVPGIYASIAWNKESAIVAKEHDNVNVLCLASRLTKPQLAKDIVDRWLKLPFSKEPRYARRIGKVRIIERSYLKSSSG